MAVVDSKRIYILGAGGSIGHSNGLFPSIAEFFSSAKILGIDLKRDFERLFDYTKSEFGRSILRRQERINIEDILTHLEIEIEKRATFDLLEVRQQLLTLIRDVLLGLELKLPGAPGQYNALSERLQDNDTIITFNWDLILDNILDRAIILNDINDKKPRTKSKRPHYQNFIENLSAYSEWIWAHMTTAKPFSSWSSNIGYSLKLHGSIDWFYCPNENCRSWHKVFPQLDPLKTYQCGECYEAMECLLIPPTLNKRYRQYPLIQRIWNLAAQEIQSAKELVIWGYSLPPTDFYSLWLIRQARKLPIESLIIINREIVNNQYNVRVEFVRHIYNLFRDRVSKDSLHLFENFDDYCGGISIFDKHSTIDKVKILKRL